MAMKQLSGIDASFLYMETPETPMHVAGLTLYDLPAGFKGSFHEYFKRFFAGRVHLIPDFGKKLAKTAFALDHPGWVDAGEVDLDWHVQPMRLDAPGGMKELEDLIGELHSEPLDRTRPLWRFTVIEGLASGQVAVYSKVHHAAMDGGAGMAIRNALYDLTPVPRDVPPPEPKAPRREPTPAERAVLGLHDMATSFMRQQLKVMEALPRAAGQAADLLAPVLARGLSAPQFPAPKTPFNVTIGNQRSYAARTVPLSVAKAIGAATGTEINNIVMAICAGALRSYLKAMRKLPDAALVAFAPISMRAVGNTDLNNQVFGMYCPLATDHADPVKRLTKIHADARLSKTMAGGLKEFAPSDYTVLGAPMLLPGLMQLYGGARLAEIAPNVANVVISNTAGPPVPLYCAGARVTALYPVSIPVHGAGLNFTVQSYCDSLDFGVTADRASTPDAERIGDLIVASFEELRDAVLGAPTKAEPKAPAAPPMKAAPGPRSRTRAAKPRRAARSAAKSASTAGLAPTAKKSAAKKSAAKKPTAKKSAANPQKPAAPAKQESAPSPASKSPAKRRAPAAKRPAAPRRARRPTPKPTGES